MKYNHGFICTYHMLETLDKECEDDDNFDYASMLYRIQLLQAFNMPKWSQNEINTHLKDLYDILKDDSIVQKMIQLVKSPLDNDPFTKFSILFSYDYFHFMHACVIDCMKHSKIHQKTEENIMNALLDKNALVDKNISINI